MRLSPRRETPPAPPPGERPTVQMIRRLGARLSALAEEGERATRERLRLALDDVFEREPMNVRESAPTTGGKKGF